MSERMIAKDAYRVRPRRIRRIYFLLLCIAPLFIFNPEMAIIDILPDLIGYILILIPLARLRDVNEEFESSRKLVAVALLINAGKYAALVLSLGGISQKEGGSASSLMMFSLVFAVLDIIFVTSAFRKFFSALSKVGEKYDCDAVVGYRQRKRRGETVRAKRNRTDSLSRYTTVFVVMRALCYAIPEFSTGSAHAYDDTVFDWSAFTSLFRIFGVIISLVFGIIWLVRSTAYFARIFRDKSFISALDCDYSASLRGKKIGFILRNISAWTIASSVALFLCADVYLYEKSLNILSDVIPALVLLAAFLMIYELFRPSKKTVALFLVTDSLWLVLSVVKDVLRYSFFSKYSMNIYEKNPDAYNLYSLFSVVTVYEAVAFCAVMLVLISTVNFINNEYAVSKLSLENESILRMKENERKEYRESYLLPAKIAVFVAALCSALYPYMLTLTTLKVPDTVDKYKSAEYILVNIGATYWFADLAVSLALAVIFRRALSALLDRSENNLMLE